jgi:plastocyanin
MRHLIASAMIATVLVAGCAPTDEPDPETTGSPAEPADDATSDDAAATDDPDEEAATEATVTIGDFFFEADTLAVQTGDTVTWTHDGDITHNVTARDGSFVSENLASGETFTHTFTQADSFEYRCTLHNQMVASIEVS